MCTLATGLTISLNKPLVVVEHHSTGHISNSSQLSWSVRRQLQSGLFCPLEWNVRRNLYMVELVAIGLTEEHLGVRKERL